ncbi:MAG: [ribosomal protein S5]-alanine N-acetyltransferase [Blastocatellia bacterium]|jgi:RimJ/RimL family protein N-acetyltransferase|nr:[ribosomal protein S5]-alanine N-acetyltransferase [Blastocatellia bacterium]
MIETERLRLIPCELAHFDALLRDPPRLEQMLGVSIVEGWSAFPESIARGQEYLKRHMDALDWWMYLFMHAADSALVGQGGFKGKADESGMVEIGYSIAPAYRNRGVATEAAQGLIDFAFSHTHVKMVDAHTLAEVNPSTRVLKKVGMKFIEALRDAEHGEVWHWRLTSDGYRKTRRSNES